MNQPSRPSKRPARDSAGSGGFTRQFDSYIGRAQAFLQEFFARAGKPVDTIYRVAVERYQQGEYADAANRLRMVTKFQPDNATAWYLLGQCELKAGDMEAAAPAFHKALRLNPQLDEARFLLAVTNPAALPREQEPRFAPLTLATEHFEEQALYYDEYNLGELDYTGHLACYEAIERYLNPNYLHFRILDLGCGTGLVGLQLRSIAGYMDGVDIARNMLAQAELRRDEREGRIYDRLHQADLRRFLLEAPAGNYDLITAANVFPYVGGLTPVFDGVAHALKAGGICTFSIEVEDTEDYGLIPGQGRYAHSVPYIEEQAKRVGLDMLDLQPFEMFAGEGMGVQFVLRKPSPQTQQSPTQQEPTQEDAAAGQGQQTTAAPAPEAPKPSPSSPASGSGQTPPGNRPPPVE
jgi:predicted TPR repeat methyltransferase